MEKIYRVQMNSKGMPNFSTAVEIDTDISEYSDKLWKNAYERGKADRPQGEWIYCEDYVGHDGYKCSECGFFVPWCYDVYADSNFIRHYHTCPHCDSRMKGADDETD